MATYELPIIAEPFQNFDVVLNNQHCNFTFRYSEIADRWSFDLSIAGTLVLAGRRVVLGIDLLWPFDFDIGQLFAVDWEGKGSEPTYEALPSGAVRLIAVY